MTETELLLQVVGEAYAFRDVSEFRSGVLELLGRLVPYDIAGFNEVGPTETFAVLTSQVAPELLDTFSELAFENPLIARYQRTRDGRPYRISDVVERDTFRSLDVYRRYYRHVGIEYQVAFCLPASPPLIVGIALCREDRDFDANEVGLLGLARPHLMHAYRNAELWSEREAMLAALQAGLDTVGRHVVVLDPHGRVEFATDGARRLAGPEITTELPRQVSGWLAVRDTPRAVTAPLRITGPAGPILVRALPTSRADRRQVLLLEAGSGEITIGALRALGLTDREAHTLQTIVLGHTPSDAAAKLGIARRTLDKHLQHAYAKLGVSTLAQATDSVWAAVGMPLPAGE